MPQVITLDKLRAERRMGAFEERVPFTIGGRRHEVVKRIVNGEMTTYDLSRSIGEMISTASGHKELLDKVVLDVELGREQVPLLYTPIYDRLEDPNFPEVFDAPWQQFGVVVFLEHLEGEEVKFGHIAAEEGPVARIRTWAAGFEYTEDHVEYNQTWRLEEYNRALGEAHNALLNHIHFDPILSFNYQSGNKTPALLVKADGTKASSASDAHPALSFRETIKKAIGDARKKKRPGNILLVAGEMIETIQEALAAMTVRGTDLPSVTGIDTVIGYDGWGVQVGKKDYSYAGVDPGKAYLIRPKRGFKELIKHDLRIDSDNADISRLVEAQIVGRFRRGVFAAVPENVQEITLPEFN